MRCLSLLQAWASLIALHEKKIESRSWSTAWRGQLAIHASKRWDPDAAYLAQQSPLFLAAWRRHGIRTLRELPLGAVIATCRLVDCVATGDIVTFLTSQEAAFGNYAAGRFAWLLEEVVALPKPIPAKGSLGLWEWREELGREGMVG